MKNIIAGLNGKILLYLLITNILLFIFMEIIFSSITITAFNNIENTILQQNLETTIDTINTDIETIKGIGEDYANWDATYELAKHNNPKFSEVDLTDDSLERLGLNYIIILDKNNSIVYFRKYYSGEIFSEYGKKEESMLKKYSKITINESSGFIKTPEGIAMFSSSPIHKSDKSGETAGTLIIIRHIDEQYIKKLSDKIKQEIYINEYTPVNNNLITGNLIQNIFILKEDKNYSNIKHYDKNISVQTTLNDINNNKLINLTITKERTIYFQAKKIILLFSLAITILLIAEFFTIYILIKKMILNKIFIINEFVEGVSKDVYKENRDIIKGNDELSDLAKAFSDSVNKISALNKEKESIFEYLPDTVLNINSKGEIITIKNTFSSDKTQKIEEIFSMDNVLLLRKNALESISAKETKKIEINANEKYYEARLIPIENNGCLIFIREVTAEKILTEKIKQKNEELEKINKLTIDRELKMIELKKEISNLRNNNNNNNN